LALKKIIKVNVNRGHFKAQSKSVRNN